MSIIVSESLPSRAVLPQSKKFDAFEVRFTMDLSSGSILLSSTFIFQVGMPAPARYALRERFSARNAQSITASEVCFVLELTQKPSAAPPIKSLLFPLPPAIVGKRIAIILPRTEEVAA